MSVALVAGCRDGACVVTPGCPAQIAAQIIVTAAGTTAGVHAVTVMVNGDTTAPLHCDSVCFVSGSSGGKYVFDVSAPGYASVQRTISVTSHPRNASVYGPEGYEGKECDCELVDEQVVSIALKPAGG
jgi:hypothetical protein